MGGDIDPNDPPEWWPKDLHFGRGNGRIVGRCGKCGGVVSTPYLWWGVGRPPKTCERCGATVDETAGLPTLTMR